MEGKILLCEGWVEKQVILDQKLNSQSKRWKTRYALLMHNNSNKMDLHFYPKKPKVYTDITDESISLCPWRYAVDILAEGKDRAHVIRIQVYDQGYVTPASSIAKMSMQFIEEALAWARCIQSLTKLTSGIQGHTFNVLVCSTPSSQSIGVSERHCILHLATEAVILATKNERSVAAVWPLSSIRNYSTADPSHFTLSSGRRSPLGEGVYIFQTMEGDGDKLFNLLDHYTGVASVSMLNISPSVEPSKRQSAAVERQSTRVPRPSVGKLPTRNSPNSSPPSKPPRKPPLPKGIRLASPQANEKSVTSPNLAAASTKVEEESKQTSSGESNKLSRGLYDLDKLLYTLEGSLKESGKKIPTSTANAEKEDINEICRNLLLDLVGKVHDSGVSPSETERRVAAQASCADSTPPGKTSRGNKPEILSPKPTSWSQSKKADPQYSSVDYKKKSFRKK